jgi:hypothetical protein
VIFLAVVCALTLAVLAFTLRDRQTERREWTRERADLLQRSQAPAQAVAEHTAQLTVLRSPPAVNTDDDGDFWASKEELAERVAEADAP